MLLTVDHGLVAESGVGGEARKTRQKVGAVQGGDEVQLRSMVRQRKTGRVRGWGEPLG